MVGLIKFIVIYNHRPKGRCFSYVKMLDKYADVLSADIFEEFKNNGVISKEIGQKFLREILSKGSSDELLNLFLNFKGRIPTEEALINSYGLDY